MTQMLDIMSGKGGTGKTTLTLHIAGHLAHHARVAVLDLDEQRSASMWYQHASSVGDVPFLVTHEKYHAISADIVLVDHPPRMTEKPLSDSILLVIRPSFFDVQAARKAMQMHASRRIIDVINAVSKSRSEDKAIVETLKPQATIYDRNIYKQTLSAGHTVFDERAGGAYGAPVARIEIDHLVQKLFARNKADIA